MARCANCGRVNREGSLFCQDCGHRLEAVATHENPGVQGRMRPPTPVAGVPAATCPVCGTVNPPGMNFCKMCGTGLRPGPAAPGAAGLPSPAAVARGATPGPVVMPAPAPAPSPATAPTQRCPTCGKPTPAGFAFCQHCGGRVGLSPPGAPPAGLAPLAEAVAATLAAPGAVPGPPGRPAGGPTPVPGAVPAVQGPFPSAGARPGAPGPGGAAAFGPAPVAGVIQGRSTATGLGGATVLSPPAVPSLGRLISVRRDGSDGQAYPIEGDRVDIGRSEGEITFADDLCLASRHARIERRGAAVVIRPLDTLNGVYLRVQSAAIESGDQILIGKEVLRFEHVDAEERDAPSTLQHGVATFGSPPRPSWGRLRQLVISGATRDVYHLVKADVVLGREEGDVRFGDDEFMSRRHAALSHRDGRVTIADQGSSNGTFVRLRGEREIRSGDVFRVGDQLLRYE